MRVRVGEIGAVLGDRSQRTCFRSHARGAARLAVLALVACGPAPVPRAAADSGEVGAASAPQRGEEAPPAAKGASPAGVGGQASPPAPSALPTPAAAKPVLLSIAGGGDVALAVRAELGRPGGAVVVYAGASWCDPCRRFHDALLAGELDREFAGVRFLEFDMDLDRERLEAAGYTARLIPLFALPGPDGRASGRQIEGGIKGPGAARHIVARLVPLIAEAERAGD